MFVPTQQTSIISNMIAIVADLIKADKLLWGGLLALDAGSPPSDHISLNSEGSLLICRTVSLLSCLASATAVQSSIPVVAA
mgnify:CR=1 FL=1